MRDVIYGRPLSERRRGKRVGGRSAHAAQVAERRKETKERGGWRKSGPSSVKDDDDDLNASSNRVGDLKPTEPTTELDARDV